MEKTPQNWRLLADMAHVLALSPGVEGIAECLSGAVVLLEPRSAACVWLLESDRLELRAVAGTASPIQLNGGSTLALGEGIAGRVALGAQSFVVGKLGDGAATAAPDFLPAGEFRWFVGAPLAANGRPEGVLVTYVRGPEDLDDECLEILRRLADLAALALSNLRHGVERGAYREQAAHRLEAELSLAEHSRLLVRSLDHSEVTQRIVENISSLFGLLVAVLYSMDPVSGDMVPIAQAGPAGDRSSTLKEGTGTVGLAIRERRAIASTDSLTDPRITYEPEVRARVETVDRRAVLAVPLVIGNRPIGALVVRDQSGRVFDQEEMWLAQAFADQAAIALENARLYAEAERHGRESESLAEERRLALEVLAQTEASYRAIVEDQTDLVCRYRPDTILTFVNNAYCRYFGKTRDELVGRSFLLRLLEEDRDMIGRRLASLTPEQPVQTHDNRVQRGDGAWRWHQWMRRAIFDEQGHLVEVQAVGRDVTELRQAEQIRQLLLHQVVSVQEEEQKRIARELHDETAQSLASLLLGLRTLSKARTLKDARARANKLNRVARRALGEVRRLVFGLRPPALDDLGLAAALEQYVAAWRTSRTTRVELVLDGLRDERLPREVETALYRILQEALSNVARHAHALAVHVAVERRPAAVAMTISDDGRGFDANGGLAPTTLAQGLGLHSMRERAAVLAGWLEIHSSPGRGTTITTEIPLERAPR